jgi:3-mercaptopyruvate sulfurtransferase SseA
MGFRNIYILDGGFQAWANAGNRPDASTPDGIQPGLMTTCREGQSLNTGTQVLAVMPRSGLPSFFEASLSYHYSPSPV